MPYLDTQTDRSPILDKVEHAMPDEIIQNHVRQEEIVKLTSGNGMSEEDKKPLKSELIKLHIDNIRHLEGLQGESLQDLGRAALLPEERMAEPTVEELQRSSQLSFKRMPNEHSFKLVRPQTQ